MYTKLALFNFTTRTLLSKQSFKIILNTYKLSCENVLNDTILMTMKKQKIL